MRYAVALGGVTKVPFVTFMSILQKYMLNYFNQFIFYTCHPSWAAVTPVKYKRDIQ